MKHKFLILYSILLFLPLRFFASHIVGGSLTYEQIAGSTYRVTLKLYRDCNYGIAFPPTVDINVTQNDGTPHSVISIPFPGASPIPPYIDTCVQNSTACLEVAEYTKVVNNLTANVGGYHLYYQYCCRNNSVQNIINPTGTGETWYAHIPGNSITSNSSPAWLNPPPIFICQGTNMLYDNSATDADGDSLVYSLFTPYNNSSITFPGNVFTTAPITWISTYGSNNPLNPSVPNSLSITSTGILSGVAPAIGQFIAGVRCEEWRNGTKIGEILRDFQFNVVNCAPVFNPVFSSNGVCNGTTVAFTNLTNPPATNYFWDFGNGATLADTSHAINPSYTYPTIGNFTTMLIINKGNACADTFLQASNFNYLIADFTSSTPGCSGEPINFYDISNINSSGNIENWNWNFGDGNTSVLQNPTHSYTAGGVYSVKLKVNSTAGCADSIVHPVNIQNAPVATAGNDVSRCSNNPSVSLNGTFLNADGGYWMGSGGFFPGNTFLSTTYTPSATAIASGSDTLLLISINNSICPADTDQVVINFYAGPTANAGLDVSVCKDTVNVPVCATFTVATGNIWQTTGSGTFVNPNQACTQYVPGLADTASGSVIIYITTTGNGDCFAASDSARITFYSTPTAAITSNNSACAGNLVPLNANSTTTTGIWNTNGTGAFAPNASLLSTFYNPSAADDAGGNVLLFFSSTNNNGCRAIHDTLDLTLIPAPIASYSSVSACPYENVIFTNTSTSAVPILYWNWNFGDASPISSLVNPIHVYSTGGPYNVTLIIKSNNGCVDTLTKSINIYDKPVANFMFDGICRSDGTSFWDSSTVIGAILTSWNWAFGDASSSSIQNPAHTYSASGNYLSTLIINTSQGCKDTASKIIAVIAGPSAGFSADAEVANPLQTIQFSDHSNGAVSWHWNFGDASIDSTSSMQNPSHAFSNTGFYDVCLIVTDMNGCTDTVCRQEIISSPPAVPSGFTPNNDGQNDFLYVYGGPFKTLKFKVYNNWGNLIFESEEQLKGWDGKRNGIDQAIGVYVYTVIGITEDGKEHKISGDVTLLR